MWAIVPAAGVGRRFKSMIPKQYLNICGAPVLRHSLNCLLKFEEFVKIVVVLHPEDKYWGDIDIGSSRIETVIDGDEHDARFTDAGPGVIIGLTAKGKAKHDASGFVVPSEIIN